MSRTTKGLKNSEVAIIFYGLNLILGFFSRKVFLDYLGSEILGLNTTAQNLLEFLNLAELGIGSAISFTLYKPLADKDNTKIQEIVSIQGWLYNRIGFIVGGLALIMMCFLPIFFKKTDLPLIYIYMSFGAFLYSSLLTYFFNYRQILLSASQQEYKVTYSYKSIILLKNIVQIIAVATLPNPYLCWIVLHVVFTTIASISLNICINSTFPQIKSSISLGKKVKTKYDVIVLKIKQLFFHKIAGFVLNQFSPLIIYAYTSLTTVAIYGNYMLIVSGVQQLCNTVFSGVNAGVGDLVAEGNKEKTLNVFEELFSIRFYIAFVMCFAIFNLSQPFVTIWVGEKYLLNNTVLLLIVAILFLTLTRTIVESFIFAYGLFQDIWAPCVEATMNLGFSIIFGYYLGITGILTGVLLSLIAIVFIWKPIFLFRYGIKHSIVFYIKLYIRHIICLVPIAILFYCINHIVTENIDNTWHVLLICILNVILYSLIVLIILNRVTIGTNRFLHRISNVLKNKLKCK